MNQLSSSTTHASPYVSITLRIVRRLVGLCVCLAGASLAFSDLLGQAW